jgi:inner membrane protein involved in colicin E2 resistance
MLRKYVVYYHNVYNKEKNLSREYFRVEKHPKLEKIWETTKSEKVSIMEKLQQANKIVDDLENDIYPEKMQRNLPKHVSIVFSRNKEQLCYDKRV